MCGTTPYNCTDPAFILSKSPSRTLSSTLSLSPSISLSESPSVTPSMSPPPPSLLPQSKSSSTPLISGTLLYVIIIAAGILGASIVGAFAVCWIQRPRESSYPKSNPNPKSRVNTVEMSKPKIEQSKPEFGEKLSCNFKNRMKL